MKSMQIFLLGLAAAYLAGCSGMATRGATEGKKPVASRSGGGYYKDDGPGDNPPPNLDAVPDATPRQEPPHRYANRPYTALGKEFVPDVSNQPYKARGMASWYGRRYHGKPTASGEIYDMYGMTAAHPTLPIPSYVRVSNPANGKRVVVRINDRGPFLEERLIDLSYTAAYKLDILRGVTPVEVERIFPGDQDDGGTGRLQTAALPPPAFAEPARLEAPPVVLVPTELSMAEPAKAQTAEPQRLPGIYLQLGAFSNPVAADELIVRLNRQLGSSLPGVQRLQAGGLYKVQAGPFGDAAAADRAAVAIQEALGIRPFKVQAKLVHHDGNALT